MARIPQEQIDWIKQEVSLAGLAERQGIELKRHGADLIGLCPFHDDKNPSLVISPEKNLWHCLGACQTGGSVIDWVMKRDRVSFRHAVELLRGEAPGVVPVESARKPAAGKDQNLSPLAADKDDQALLRQVIEHYHETLMQSPEVLAYLEQRGLNNPELIEQFRLGFANRTLAYRLAGKKSKAGREVRGQLQKVGLLRQSGHEHFNGSLIIPVLDAEGNVLEVYGRKITTGLRKGTPLHLYLPGPHRGVWNVEALAEHDEIILCESLIDALSFWNAGYQNVTASYGVEGFTAEHLEAFKTHGIKRVLIAYDQDEAGERAAGKLADKLLAGGLEAYRIHFPKGMDANEYALKVQPAGKGLGVVIRAAKWLGKGEPPAPAESTGMPASDDTLVINAQTGELLNAPQPQPAQGPSPPLAAGTAPTPQEPPAPAASPVTPPSAPDLPIERNGEEIRLTLGDRQYRIRGLEKNLSAAQMKINLLVSRGEAFHVDTLELYAARQRGAFLKQAAQELGLAEDVLKRDLGRILLKLEQLQAEQIKAAVEAKDEVVVLSEEEQAEALALLQSADLIDRIQSDFERCGLVGEQGNTLVGYLACTSRKLESPLALLIQSNSAAGKSTLLNAVLALMPEEERVQYSALTGQALYYLGESDLKHKILAIAEEEGAGQAAYALKLLQSEGELSIASTGKDPATGRLQTEEYRVEGPVMLALTTTAVEIDAELLNRCLVLGVDEAREQTRAIHQKQRRRRTLEGLKAKRTEQQVLTLHRNAQRLLRPLVVINPWAESLGFLDHQTRTRRDHEKYLTLIDAVALLHQYQRTVKTLELAGETVDYIEVSPEDIRLANRLAHQVLGRTLDELPPQTRSLLNRIHEWTETQCRERQILQGDFRFSRRQLREAFGGGDTQLKIHLGRLVELEYLLVHRNGQRFEYELRWDGQGADGQAFMMGLIEPGEKEKAGESGRYGADRSGVNGQRSGQEGKQSGSGRPLVGGVSGSGRSGETGVETKPGKGSGESAGHNGENARIGDGENDLVVSYPTTTAEPASPAVAGGLN